MDDNALPLAEDTTVIVHVTTPGGMVITVNPEQFDTMQLQYSHWTGDYQGAARTMARLTGCDVTIEVKQLVTIRHKQKT